MQDKINEIRDILSDPAVRPYYLAGIVVCAIVAIYRRWKRREPKQRNPQNSHTGSGVLLQITPEDAISTHEAFEGFLAIGGVGSGKTSTMSHLMRAFMQWGFGMLILTAKPDDYDGIRKIAAEERRESDLMRLAPDEALRLNFLDYVLRSPGGITAASQFMQDLVDFSTRTGTMNTTEPFWPIAAARKIRMAIILIMAAKGSCTVEDVYHFCTSMPNSEEEKNTASFLKSFCGQCLLTLKDKPISHDVDLALSFVLSEWPRLSDRTGGCIDAYVINLLEKFVHGHVRELVATETNITPDALGEGKIICVDMPILSFREPGQFCQMTWKLLAQRWALARKITPDSRPVVLWADEAQLHALPQVDSMTQAVARSQRLIQVAITQNLPLLISTLKSREDAISWISNLQTKLIFANGDKDTNEYFSGLFGETRELLFNTHSDSKPYDLIDDVMGNWHGSAGGMSETFYPAVPPDRFTRLRKGGREFGFVVDAYVFQGGRVFASNGKTWVKASFQQRV